MSKIAPKKTRSARTENALHHATANAPTVISNALKTVIKSAEISTMIPVWSGDRRKHARRVKFVPADSVLTLALANVPRADTGVPAKRRKNANMTILMAAQNGVQSRRATRMKSASIAQPDWKDGKHNAIRSQNRLVTLTLQ